MSVFPVFNRVKQCRHGQMIYNVNDMFVGRSLDVYGEFSEGEIGLFGELVQPGQSVVEIGANIGAFTVFLAQHVGRQGVVLAIEPQRLVFQTLCANLALNSITNVACFQQASGAQHGSLHVPQLDPLVVNNFGGLALGEYQRGQVVAVVPLDAFNLQRCDFIKIDVEGMEEDVLRGAVETIARCRPIMYVENDRPEKCESLIRYIASLGYRMYWHCPPLFNPSNFLGNPENVFGELLSANLACFHRDAVQRVPAHVQEALPS
ncbi:MAG: FkbM family methyltransferase [Pirellulales bacterium]